MRKIQGVAQAVERRLEWFYHQAGWIAGGLAIIMMVAIVREVVGRYLFNNPSDWSLELSTYLLVGLVYIGSPYTALTDGHVRIDVFYGRFKHKGKVIADIFISLVCITYCVILTWQSGILAWDSLINGLCSCEAMMWPLWPSQILIPIFVFFSILVFMGKLSHSLRLLHKGGVQSWSGG